MEREQRSEGLLRDFIRANCQRMKHELAKRDCGLGQYRRDPGAAATVIPLQLHSRCVKRTHTITHQQLLGDLPLADTYCVTTDRPKAGEHGHWKQSLPGEEEEDHTPLHPSSIQAWMSVKLTSRVFWRACRYLPACFFNCIHFSNQQEKKQCGFFFLLSLIQTLPQYLRLNQHLIGVLLCVSAYAYFRFLLSWNKTTVPRSCQD